MSNSKIDLIEQAIHTQSKLVVSFDTRAGVRADVVMPLRWTSSGELCAFSYEANGEIFINPSVIQKCAVYDSTLEGTEPSLTEPTNRSVQTTPSGPARVVNSSAEEQIALSNIPASSPRLSRRKLHPESISISGIEDVKSREDWRRLLDFYRECLVHENRQEYVIDRSKDQVQFFNAPLDQLESFLEGQSYLSFHQKKNQNLYKFITSIQKRNNQQLYIGYPIFVAESSRLAPVLIAPITAKTDKDQVVLEAEEYEVSYAALASLGLRDEEILTVLASISGSFSQNGKLSMQSLIDLVIKLTGELLGVDLSHLNGQTGSDMPNTFDYRPCLFWARPGIATANLIKELDTLGTFWSSVPDPLKSLITTSPAYEYPEAPSESNDRNIYVAPAYERQRQSITASLTQPITVVTGPPGTGKSQFILNLIVQAVMRGENVLFASRNNKAVDVVMDRLQGEEVRFPGAIRTGNKEQRRRAVEHIFGRLRELSAPEQGGEDIEALQDRYWQFQHQYLNKQTLLKIVRSKHGLLASRNTELDDIRKLIPNNLLSVVENLSFSFGSGEYEYLQSFLSKQRMEVLELRSRVDAVVDEINTDFKPESEAMPFVGYLHNYEDQWGSVGSDALRPLNLASIDNIQTFLALWQAFLKATEIQIDLNAVSTTYREQKADLEKKEANLSEAQLSDVRYVMETMQMEVISSNNNKSKECLAQSQRLLASKSSLWIRLLAWLGFRNPLHDLAKQLDELQQNIQAKVQIPEKPTWKNLQALHEIALSLSAIWDVALTSAQTNQLREKLTEARLALESVSSQLPKSLAENVKKLNPSLQIISTTQDKINYFSEQATALNKAAEDLKLNTQSKLDKNSDELEFLKELRARVKSAAFDLWAESIQSEPAVLISFLSDWRNILSYWKTQDAVHVLKGELKAIPTEQTLSVEVSELGGTLFKLGSKIIAKQWRKNARSEDPSVFQQAEQYVSAARQLAEKEFTPMYSQLKAVEENTLPAVMKLFPVWATTNLSAKSNFPLTPGLFDLVIIDEASQCDLPSALPLLYRGNRVVVVGDAMQLRHVAKIIPKAEQEASQKHGVSLVRYSYSQFSLFDVANRSVQPKPSTILLNEHYRSDPQIFGFSTEEFYSEELKIYTDISRFSLPSDYIKDGTGVFWVDTPGLAQHPGGGSAFNDIEIRTIAELIPKLMSDLKRRKMNNLKFGIISPYREQERRILNWLDSYQRSDPNIQDRITVGTAHKFQGDERDIVIFSPVISEGIKEKSQEWLENTSNLLNVAISRARITMIVVGDWKYCLSLDKNSKYRKLAEYVARHQNRVVASTDALPVFKGLPLDIIGVLLDRHNRDRNRLTLQKLLLACDQFVWWMDPFISNGIFDLLIDIVKHPEFKLKDVRILTSKEQIWDERNPVNPNLIKNVQKEFTRYGVSVQLGLLPKREIPHDRYFYSVGYAINMPPFGGAYGEHKMVSEYTESKTKADFFEKHWSRAEKY